MSEELFAWVNDTPAGDTQIIAAFLPTLGWVPLVSAVEHVALVMRDVAQHHADKHGFPAMLVRYRAEGVLDTLAPLRTEH